MFNCQVLEVESYQKEKHIARNLKLDAVLLGNILKFI